MLALEGVAKSFGSVRAVDGVSLEVSEGEFFSLLGPSGCGKTSLLRTIAGIYEADGGRIVLKGGDLRGRPMHARDIALVFQNYALFPHLTAFENVAFGLRMRKTPKHEIARRVSEALALVRMSGFEARRPAELSGGQQQRVALARAVVVRPSLLLLDEPLSNLDAKLRDEMRDEIRTVQRTLKITTLLVTHDLREAFAVSDRVAIMRSGALEQVGSPADLYDRPATRFVAGFVGHQNIFAGTIEAVEDKGVKIRSEDGTLFTAQRRQGQKWSVGARGWGSVRAERVRIGSEAGPQARSATVEDATYLGRSVELKLRLGALPLRASLSNRGQRIPAAGDTVPVAWDDRDVVAGPEERA
jgi:ABC-type Fe3+/spermidine/putrescine transport system ATPase subunit